MGKGKKKRARELRKLAKLKRKVMGPSELPEAQPWAVGAVGKFYRPIKKSLTIRIDADVLEWFKSQGKGYQTRINEALRAAMMEHAG